MGSRSSIAKTNTTLSFVLHRFIYTYWLQLDITLYVILFGSKYRLDGMMTVFRIYTERSLYSLGILTW